uniref:Uncharacterized protein n=1 Tax=Anguilla anguilla TaxID=7936 RepID=A0A0E9U0F1_ANGAN
MRTLFIPVISLKSKKC